MTNEEKHKVINALRISAPVMAVTQEEFNDYIQTLTKIMDWLEQEPILDKIRAEIEANMESIIGKYDSHTPTRDMPSAKIERNSAREECLQIIDKYKAESEE